MPGFPIIDSHVHIYDPEALSYPWMDRVAALKSPHLPADYDRQRDGVAIDRYVFVEVDAAPGQRVDEARWVGALADPRLAAIVASAAIEDGAAVRPQLDALMAATPKLRGIRRLIQGEAVDFCIQPGFVEGVKLLAGYDLSFDLCIFHPQFDSALELVRRCPEIRFVLDHIGKPGIKAGIDQPWRDQMKALAALPNVWCKLSGVVTEADPAAWTRAQIEPYIRHTIDCFGFERTLFGSDWPVCELASSYRRWVETLDAILVDASEAELRRLYRDTAIEFYRLG
jgi:L-fuconolactonase